MATGVGRGGGRKAGAKGEGPGPRCCALSALTPAPSPPPHTTGALAFHLSLPPSFCPEAQALGLSGTPLRSEWQAGREASWVQMQGPRVLS